MPTLFPFVGVSYGCLGVDKVLAKAKEERQIRGSLHCAATVRLFAASVGMTEFLG